MLCVNIQMTMTCGQRAGDRVSGSGGGESQDGPRERTAFARATGLHELKLLEEGEHVVVWEFVDEDGGEDVDEEYRDGDDHSVDLDVGAGVDAVDIPFELVGEVASAGAVAEAGHVQGVAAARHI